MGVIIILNFGKEPCITQDKEVNDSVLQPSFSLALPSITAVPPIGQMTRKGPAG